MALLNIHNEINIDILRGNNQQFANCGSGWLELLFHAENRIILFYFYDFIAVSLFVINIFVFICS